MGMIELQKVEKWYDDVCVINGIDLTIEDGEFLVFVGPSGCGKSTLLRMIAGLEESSRGDIIIDENNVTADSPARRGLAMVFQSYALYPHMNVADNMGFSLKTAGAKPEVITSKVNDAAKALKLESLLQRRPKDLSGGQRQRVAIGRAIVRDPTAFLFDEPLSNLDAALRVEMRHEVARLHQQLKRTMIYVTHDQVEAMTLADRIVVLQGGNIEQIGSPRELYQAPKNLFVAQFIGSPKMNLLTGTCHDGMFVAVDNPLVAAPQQACTLGIRPEDLCISTHGDGQLNGVVEVVEYQGADVFVFVNTACGIVNIRCGGQQIYTRGDHVSIHLDSEYCHYFDTTGERI